MSQSHSSGAFLLMRFRDTGTTPTFIDVRIYSERTPTQRNGEFYACLSEIHAPSFHEALAHMHERCRTWTSLRWTLPYLARDEERRRETVSRGARGVRA